MVSGGNGGAWSRFPYTQAKGRLLPVQLSLHNTVIFFHLTQDEDKKLKALQDTSQGDTLEAWKAARASGEIKTATSGACVCACVRACVHSCTHAHIPGCAAYRITSRRSNARQEVGSHGFRGLVRGANRHAPSLHVRACACVRVGVVGACSRVHPRTCVCLAMDITDEVTPEPDERVLHPQ